MVDTRRASCTKLSIPQIRDPRKSARPSSSGPAPLGDGLVDALVFPAGYAARETAPDRPCGPRKADVSTHADSRARLSDIRVAQQHSLRQLCGLPSPHGAPCLGGKERDRLGNCKCSCHSVSGVTDVTSKTSHLAPFSCKRTKTYSPLCVQKRKGS